MGLRKDLLTRGYFPKELPSPFGTDPFGSLVDSDPAVTSLVSSTRANESRFSYFKRINSIRRVLSIPHPNWQFQVSDWLEKNWTHLSGLFSPHSLSIPSQSTATNRAVNTGIQRDKLLSESIGYKYCMSVDISNFYRSIYTHSIPWGIAGKSIAKQNYKNGVKTIGDDLDKFVRGGNQGQTKGIPIGPDTSLIIAELILKQTDTALAQAHPFVKLVRWYDDHWILGNDPGELDNAFVTLQNVLLDFELELNDLKIKKYALPLQMHKPWTFKLRHHSLDTLNDYISFFDEIHATQREHEDDVVKYGLKIALRQIERQKQTLTDRHVFLFMHCIYHYPQSIQTLLEFPTTLEEMNNLINLSDIVSKSIEEHGPRRHSYEVSWAVWLAIVLDLKLSTKVTPILQNMTDCVTAILSTYASTKGVLPGFNFNNYCALMNRSEFFGENWLLYYETHANPKLHPLLLAYQGLGYNLSTDALLRYLEKNQVMFFDPDEAMNSYSEKLDELTRKREGIDTYDEEDEEDLEDLYESAEVDDAEEGFDFGP